jgi:hypothetical protein
MYQQLMLINEDSQKVQQPIKLTNGPLSSKSTTTKTFAPITTKLFQELFSPQKKHQIA